MQAVMGGSQEIATWAWHDGVSGRVGAPRDTAGERHNAGRWSPPASRVETPLMIDAIVPD